MVFTLSLLLSRRCQHWFAILSDLLIFNIMTEVIHLNVSVTTTISIINISDVILYLLYVWYSNRGNEDEDKDPAL
jgi:hypothetical protein